MDKYIDLQLTVLRKLGLAFCDDFLTALFGADIGAAWYCFDAVVGLELGGEFLG